MERDFYVSMWILKNGSFVMKLPFIISITILI
jgi:hypothetical protein